MKLITSLLFLFSPVMLLTAQLVVKMDLPPQPDEPVTAATIFEQGLPAGIPNILSPMGYDINGGLPPYNFQWMENSALLSYGEIVVITPNADKTYTVIISDQNNCSVNLPIKIDHSGQPGRKISSEPYFTVQQSAGSEYFSIKINKSFEGEALLRLYDVKGILHMDKKVSGLVEIPLKLKQGLYFLSIQSKTFSQIEKFVVN